MAASRANQLPLILKSMKGSRSESGIANPLWRAQRNPRKLRCNGTCNLLEVRAIRPQAAALPMARGHCHKKNHDEVECAWRRKMVPQLNTRPLKIAGRSSLKISSL